MVNRVELVLLKLHCTRFFSYRKSPKNTKLNIVDFSTFKRRENDDAGKEKSRNNNVSRCR